MPDSLFDDLTLRAASASFRSAFRRIFGVPFTDYLTFINRNLADPTNPPTMRRALVDEFERRMAKVDKELQKEQPTQK